MAFAPGRTRPHQICEMKSTHVGQVFPRVAREGEQRDTDRPLAATHQAHAARMRLGLAPARASLCADIDRRSSARLVTRIDLVPQPEGAAGLRTLQHDLTSYRQAIRRKAGCCGLISYSNSGSVRTALGKKLAEVSRQLVSTVPATKLALLEQLDRWENCVAGSGRKAYRGGKPHKTAH